MYPIYLTDKQIENIILECLIKVRYQDTDIIRELAKRPEVRMMYSICKNSGVPFWSGTVTEWNSLQKRLVYWCNFYTNVDQAVDRPPDRIVENNSMLDRWLEKKAREASERYESEWARGSAGIKKSAYDQDEVWELG